MTESTSSPVQAGANRRQFLLGGAAVGVGAVAALGIDRAINQQADRPATSPLNGDDTVPFYGAHQAGIDTVPQAHIAFFGLDLRDDVDRAGLARLMRILTDDAARLTQGVPPLADSEPEMVVAPARLTVTFGFGPDFVERAKGQQPKWLKPLPAFEIDALRPEYSDGDLLIQVASDDPMTLAHAGRMLLKDTRSFATLKWSQPGFRRAHGTEKPGTTMRNLFGQVDGTTNPRPGTDDFTEVVWSQEGWMSGGTSIVLRRIQMDLDEWDRVDRAARDNVLGRFQSNGAPLTSNPHRAAAEFDEPDFEAKNAIGLTVIPAAAHIARSRPAAGQEQERIFRRAYNYEAVPSGDEITNAGLLFASYQADVEAQFLPIQRRLSEVDMLNEWTTPVGSSVFAIPPGCAEGGFIGDTLLT